MPVYDGAGRVIAYERSIAPERLAALSPNTHLGEMIGAWAGRHAEEAAATAFNQVLVDQMKIRWDADKKAGRVGEYVNLADGQLKDPVLLDAWKNVPAEVRAYAYKVFGPNLFPIRKDMLNNTVGYPLVAANRLARSGTVLQRRSADWHLPLPPLIGPSNRLEASIRSACRAAMI